MNSIILPTLCLTLMAVASEAFPSYHWPRPSAHQRRNSVQYTPPGTYSLALSPYRMTSPMAPSVVPGNNALYNFFPMALRLFEPFRQLSQVQYIPVFFAPRYPVRVKHPAISVEDGDSFSDGYNDGFDDDDHSSEQRVRVASFPTQIGPVHSTRGSANHLTHSAPAGIVQSSQPSFHYERFANSKRSSHW